MEYRIKDYTIKGQRILLPRQTSIEDLRLIFNETQKKLICSTATKDNVTLVQGEGGTLVEVPTSVCSLNSTDLLTIKCDYGDNLEEVKDAVETQLPALADKIDNIKLPEIDTTELAKQGDNPEATNSAIFNAVKSIPDISLLYAARAEKNDDGVNTYSIVLPVTAKVTYDNNGVATIQL